MPFDAATVKCITGELSALLSGGRIDKIYMPNPYDVILYIRSLGKNCKLLISANPSLPRILISDFGFENPAVPLGFCMLLRKHLANGKITSIAQPGFERMIDITVSYRDELGDLNDRHLIFELMGHRSNIILTDHEYKILDCLRRIDGSLSSVRLVLPGLRYQCPPAQEKLDPVLVTPDQIKDTIFSPSFHGGMRTDKYILDCFSGLSPLLCREFVFTAKGDTSALRSDFSDDNLNSLCTVLNQAFSAIRDGNFSPCIIMQGDKPLDFSALPIVQYQNQVQVNHPACLCDALDGFYTGKEVKSGMEQRGNYILKALDTAIARCARKINLQKTALEASAGMDKHRLIGDLLTANLHTVSFGARSVRVTDFYDPDMPQIEILLDPMLSPSDNAQRYYKKYAKLKSTSVMAAQQLQNSQEELDYLLGVQNTVKLCDNPKDLSQIKKELTDMGYLRNTEKRQKKVKQESRPQEFTSSDGLKILVGKNNYQNDYLTFKVAKNGDLWFHTKDIHGSHTVIISDGKEVPAQTILEAAMLAGHFSKARTSANIPVDYTLIKYVKKPSGARPGMVIYTGHSTLYVTPDKETLQRLTGKTIQ